MSLKRNWLAINLILAGFIVVVLFNNCQPMETTEKTDASAQTPGGGFPGPDNGQMSPGRDYFEKTIRPMMTVSCGSCHALPKDLPPGTVPGPLTIFDYTRMRNLVSAGPTASNNPLLNKIKGAGHNLCFGDVNGSVSPCLEFKAWVTLEFPLLADGIAGAVVNISPTGVIRGWAMDPRNPAATISVFVYVNGPAGQGQLVQQVVANQSSVDQFNGHYFTVSLPAQYADGTMKSLYIYGVSATTDNLLPGMPYPYVAYTPSTQGRNFYNTNISPQLNQCRNCHTVVNYDQHFLNLLNPMPAFGGTANNNELINKMNGQNHGGGGFCGGNKNNGICGLVQQWWNIEFQ